MLRWMLVAVGLAVLVGDLANDRMLLAGAETPWLIAMAARNLLLAAGLVGLVLNKRWGYLVLLASVLLGLVRRALFLQALSGDWLAVHSGADLVFRLLALAAILDFLRAR